MVVATYRPTFTQVPAILWGRLLEAYRDINLEGPNISLRTPHNFCLISMTGHRTRTITSMEITETGTLPINVRFIRCAGAYNEAEMMTMNPIAEVAHRVKGSNIYTVKYIFSRTSAGRKDSCVICLPEDTFLLASLAAVTP